MGKFWWRFKGWLIERLAAGSSVAVNLDYVGTIHMRGRRWVLRNTRCKNIYPVDG